MRRIILTLAVLVVGFGWSATATAAQRTFANWYATCDNQRTCTIIGVTLPDADGEAFVRITRARAGAARVSVVFDAMPDVNPPGPWTFEVDARPVPGLSTTSRRTTTDTGSETDHDRWADLTARQSAVLMAAIGHGNVLVFRESGRQLGSFSLLGLAGAMQWVDEQQSHGGAVAAPVIHRVALPAQTHLPRRPSRAVLAAREDCNDSLTTPAAVAAVHRLGPNLLLWHMRCEAGNDNDVDQYILSDGQGGGARLIAFPMAPGEAADNMPFNSRFDPRTGVLHALSRGRSLGDCGSLTDWVWDGHAFQLWREHAMSDCRGVRSDGWPSVYAATVR